MPDKKNKIDEIRSTEVQEILGHIPHWTIRWGISVIFILIIILLAVSWVVKYPDYIQGKVVVKTQKPPVKLHAKNTGLLKHMNFVSGDTIKVGDVLADIENPISFETINRVKEQLNTIERYIVNEDLDVQFPDVDHDIFTLGSIQNQYNTLKSGLSDLKTIKEDDFFKRKVDNLKKQIEYYSRLVIISNRKLQLGEQEFNNAKLQFETQKELYEKNVVSKIEYIKQENIYIQNKHQLESYKQSYVQNNISRTEYQKQLDELIFNQKEQERKLTEQIKSGIQSIRNEFNTWNHNYSIIAPVSGVLHFQEPIFENKTVNANQWLFAITPLDNAFIGQVFVPALGFGKVQDNQTVYVKLDNYPYQQYGQIVGKVSKRHVIPKSSEKESSNYIEVVFDHPGQTTYNKNIELNPENTGVAQIVTEDRRIIQRIFSFLREKTSR